MPLESHVIIELQHNRHIIVKTIGKIAYEFVIENLLHLSLLTPVNANAMRLSFVW